MLWRWLYTGELDTHRYCSMDDDWWILNEYEQSQRVCQLLCRVHMLGERLLFDWRFLQDVVQQELHTLIEKAEISPFTPEILLEVLSNSAPVEYPPCGAHESLRPFVLYHWSSFDFSTKINYSAYFECFERDGEFAAEMMAYMASELEWAVERWGKQTKSTIDINAKKKQLAADDGLSQCVERRYGKCDGVWLACRYMCTWTGCTTTAFRTYSRCFELDGAFAANVMWYMAEELLWVVDRWGMERGWSVDFAAEKQEEEYEEALQSMVDKIMRRGGWN